MSDLTDIPMITPAKLGAIIEHNVLRLRETVMVVGQFGGGKSEIAAQNIERLGAFHCDVRLAQYQSVDLKGGPDMRGDWLTWKPASTLPIIHPNGTSNPLFPKDRPIIITFDEFTSAGRDVFAVAYQAVNENRIGEFPFMPNVSIMCMGNRAQDKGIVNVMPKPLENRMTWFELGISVKAWCEEMQRRGADPRFMAFLTWQKTLLCNYDPKSSGTIVATPRTWWKAIRYFMDPDMPHAIRDDSMMGAIGRGPFTAFKGFLDVWSQLTPLKKILADPMGVDVPREESFRYAMAMSVANEMNKQTLKALNQYIMRFPSEYVIFAWQMAMARKDVTRDLYTSPEFIEVGRKYQAIIQG